MIGLLNTASLAALALVLLGSASALVVSVAYPLRRVTLRRLDPAARARRVILWAASPLLLGLLLTALCFLPSALARIGIGADHCPAHDDDHPHLCLLHRPHARALGVTRSVPLVAGTALLVVVARQCVRSRRLVSSLRPISPADPISGILLVQTEEPLCFTAGLLRPAIYVSSRMASSIPGTSLEAILEHERGHVRRRDPLRRLIVSALSSLHLPHTRRLLREDFALACEQECDGEAVRRTGDPLLVAHTILLVERLLMSGRAVPLAAAVSFGGSNVDARVRSLLDPPAAPAPRWSPWSYLLVGSVAVAVADPLHHATETVLGLLTR